MQHVACTVHVMGGAFFKIGAKSYLNKFAYTATLVACEWAEIIRKLVTEGYNTVVGGWAAPVFI